MRDAIQEALNAPRCATVFLDAAVRPSGCLVRQRVLDDVDIAAIPVPEKNAETLFLIDLDSRDQKGPERVSRDVDIHGVENPAGGKLKPDCTVFRPKKGSLFQATLLSRSSRLDCKAITFSFSLLLFSLELSSFFSSLSLLGSLYIWRSALTNGH